MNSVYTLNKFTNAKIVNNRVCLIVSNVIESTVISEEHDHQSPVSAGVRWNSGLDEGILVIIPFS